MRIPRALGIDPEGAGHPQLFQLNIIAEKVALVNMI